AASPTQAARTRVHLHAARVPPAAPASPRARSSLHTRQLAGIHRTHRPAPQRTVQRQSIPQMTRSGGRTFNANRFTLLNFQPSTLNSNPLLAAVPGPPVSCHESKITGDWSQFDVS